MTDIDKDFYALLIGIDYYLPNSPFPHLGGAVRDINQVADYLDKTLQIPSEQIIKLTSPLSNTNSTGDIRAAEKPPTYANIVGAFGEITKTAKKGDIVYIHYSGHGGRVKTIFPSLKTGENQYDEGLVPMDVGEKGLYLRDVEMTTLLKRMTDKGLVVTLVFDSCHSGGATRADGQVRGARNGDPDDTDRPFYSEVAVREELERNWLEVTGNSPKDAWVPNRGYVLLGACRPTEFAYEAAIDGTERNGALTYFMYETLKTVGSDLTYQQLYDRLKGQIKSRFPSQYPMLLGDGSRKIFDSASKKVLYSLTVIKVDDDKVTLDGGIAQGLSRGGRFALYPVGDDFSDRTRRLVAIEIVELQADTATARVLSAEESGVTPNIEAIAPGLPAVMESVPVDLKSRIRLFSKTVGDAEDQLTAELAEKQAGALEKVRGAMAGNGWLLEVEGDEIEARYQVSVDREGNYEIAQRMPIENLNPPLSIDDPLAPAEVVKRLVHITKYNNALGLENPASELAGLIEYKLLDANKQAFPDQNNIVLKHGERVQIRIKNLSLEPLNIAILDFTPTWEISQIPIQGGRGAYFSLPAGQEIFSHPGRFEVPEGGYYKGSTETLKLFATRGMANFQWLLLPTLDPPEKAKEEYRSRRGSLREASRSAGTANPFDKLLSMIGEDRPPELTRAFVSDSDPDAEWLTCSIVLTVKR